MRLINQSVNVWGECPNIKDTEEFLKWIEKAGRVCYNSEDKITKGSAKPFIEKIIKNGHTSVLETSGIGIKSLMSIKGKYFENYVDKDKSIHNYANFRSFYELYKSLNKRISLDKIIEDICSKSVIPSEDIPRDFKRVTVEFTTNRAMTHELVRHRVMSFLQLSQRYVDLYLSNNSDSNSEKGIDFIKPIWYDKSTKKVRDSFDEFLECSERSYKYLRESGKAPQQAREVLPNACATRIIITGYLKDWDDLINLRKASGADPTMKALIKELIDKFNELGYCK